MVDGFCVTASAHTLHQATNSHYREEKKPKMSVIRSCSAISQISQSQQKSEPFKKIFRLKFAACVNVVIKSVQSSQRIEEIRIFFEDA